MSPSLQKRSEAVFGVGNAYSNQNKLSVQTLELLIPKMSQEIVIVFNGNAILSLQNCFPIC